MRLTLIALLLACLAPLVVAAEEVDYTPLAVGLQWRMKVTITSPEGSTARATMTRSITGTQQINGLTYYVVTTDFGDTPGLRSFTVYRRRGPNGIFTIKANDLTRREYLELPLPLKVGTSWESGAPDTIKLTAETEAEVKAGNRIFEKCLRIVRTATDDSPQGTFYLAPGVGNVMETSKSGDYVFEFVLESFADTSKKQP